MAKLTLSDVTGGYAIPAVINANNALVETALENTLSRDGTSPNAMSADLDMNSNRIINTTTPLSSTDAANKAYVDAASATEGNTLASYLSDATDVAKGDALVAFKQSNSSGALTGAASRTVHQKLQESVSVKDFGAVGDGVADDRGSFNTTQTSAPGRVLFIPNGNYAIASNLTLSGVSLWFERGAKLIPAAGVTVTIDGLILADESQIFDLSAAASAVKLNNQPEISVSWFGWTTGTNSTAVRAANKTAFDNAVLALSTGKYSGVITFPVGCGYCDTGITFASGTYGLRLKGHVPWNGKASSEMSASDTLSLDAHSRIGFEGSGIAIDASGTLRRGIAWENLVLNYSGHLTNTGFGTQPDTILKIGNEGGIKNCYIQGGGTDCLLLGGLVIDYKVERTTVGRTTTLSSVGHGVHVNSDANTTFTMDGCYVHLAQKGLYMRNGENFKFRDTIFESNVEEGIHLLRDDTSGWGRPRNTTFEGCYIEDNQSGSASPNYQVKLSETASAYGPSSTNFIGCHFTANSSANRLLVNLSACDVATFLGCDGIGIQNVNTEISVGSFGRRVQFINCNSIASPSWLTAVRERVQVIGNTNDDGILVSLFDTASVGIKTFSFQWAISNPAANTANQVCDMACGAVAGIQDISIPYANLPLSLSAMANTTFANGQITFKVQYRISGTWTDSPLTLVMTAANSGAPVQNTLAQNWFSNNKAAATRTRIVATTDATFDGTTVDFGVHAVYAG